MTLPKCIYSNVFLHEVIFLWFTDLIYLIVYFETCTVYICTPIYSRILAYWLMLSVLQTTENKLHLILSYPIFSHNNCSPHDDVIKWKHFPRYWPFVRGIHRSPVNSPHKWSVTQSFDVFFDLRLNKRLSKHSWGWWFETLSRPLWRHRNV